MISHLIPIGQAYGSNVSTWSETDLTLIGTMVAGLTTTEITTLQMTSADTLTTMGTSYSFTSAQVGPCYPSQRGQVSNCLLNN